MKKAIFIMALILSGAIMNAQTKTVVKTDDLLAPIKEYVAKNYVGFTIKEASKVEANAMVTYEVVIEKGAMKHTLVFDKDGKFVKQVAAQAGAPAKKEAPKKPAATKAPAKK
ncbi:MAG: hypothetical protein ACPLXM_01035 [Bacteroidales bacterium]